MRSETARKADANDIRELLAKELHSTKTQLESVQDELRELINNENSSSANRLHGLREEVRKAINDSSSDLFAMLDKKADVTEVHSLMSEKPDM